MPAPKRLIGRIEFLMHPSASEAFHFVGTAESEALLAAVRGSTADPRTGIFGPDSVSWKINRESALFLAAGRAALLQLAHPWVATALAQHSRVLSKPVARFHNTFRIVFTMIFGTLDQALAAARHLHQLHAGIGGKMQETVAKYARGSTYEANESGALRWVYATLVDSALLAYEAALPALTPSERTKYYNESRTLAGLFGISATALPADWEAFAAYMREMCASDALGVSGPARAMTHRLLTGAGSRIPIPGWYRGLTAAWLPERFRLEFQLSLNARQRRSAQAALRNIRRIYPHLPESLRFVGPWHEATARLNGRRPGIAANLGNRFWIGQPVLPFVSDRS